VTVAPAIDARLPRGARVLRLLTPTLGAQLTASPLLLARMHALSWAGVATNLVAVPIAGLLLAAAWFAALLDLALPGAAHLAYSACDALALALRAVAGLGAGAPGALVALGHSPAAPIAATAAPLL